MSFGFNNTLAPAINSPYGTAVHPSRLPNMSNNVNARSTARTLNNIRSNRFGAVPVATPSIAPNTMFFNGSAQTRPVYGYGAFRNNVQTNLVARAFPNSYNAERSGLNYNYIDPYAQYSLDPRLYRGPTYPNGYPYPYSLADAGYYNQYGYGAYPYGAPVNAPPLYSYPYTAPECAPYVSCENTSDPNDCRSCVSSLGGSSHCVDQICGPHVPRG